MPIDMNFQNLKRSNQNAEVAVVRVVVFVCSSLYCHISCSSFSSQGGSEDTKRGAKIKGESQFTRTIKAVLRVTEFD